MCIKRIFSCALVLCALAVAFPVSGITADDTKDLSIYFRPAVRFGTDDRVLFIMDFLVPVYRGNKDLLFVNTKFTPDTDEAWETNLGVGYRRLILDDKLVLGGNLFYDHRKTAYGSHFDQIGLGLEAMAEPGGVGLATRLNYYQPLTKAKMGVDFGYVFYGNGIYTAGIEEPMTGFDYEAGVRIPGISNYVETWAYAGGYHFFGSHVPDINGFSARIEAMPTDFVRLGFEYRNDNINHDEYYGEVALEIPFSITNLVAGKNAFEGIGDVFKGSRSLKDRMVEHVHRDVDIVVGKDFLSGPEAASGDGTLRDGIIFVSDTGTASGTGTFENPYNTLAAAEADPLLGSSIYTIHVMRGNGTGLAGNDFNVHSTGVTIWGAGTTNPAYPYITNLAPGWPLITSTLTMNAQDMTVMGLYFNVSNASAITIGSGAAGAGLSITKNRIDSTGAYGIYGYFNNDFGTADDPVVISGNTISINSIINASGINLGNLTTGSIYASILNNSIDVDTSGSFGSGIMLNANAGGSGGIGNIVSTISGNTITGVSTPSASASGMYLFGRTSIAVSITGNTISGIVSPNNAYGIYLSSAGPISGPVTGNTITGISSTYRAYGMYASTNGTLGTASSPLVFTGNSGTLSALAANETYMAYLQSGIPASSYVNIGTDTSGIGMGDNNFTTTTNWDGNYLTTGGPIRTNNSSYIHNTNP